MSYAMLCQTVKSLARRRHRVTALRLLLQRVTSQSTPSPEENSNFLLTFSIIVGFLCNTPTL